MALQREPGAQQREPAPGTIDFAGVVDALQQAFDFADLVAQHQLGRQAARVPENPVGDAQFFRNRAVVIERQRPAAAGQVFEFAGALRGLDAFFGETVE